MAIVARETPSCKDPLAGPGRLQQLLCLWYGKGRNCQQATSINKDDKGWKSLVTTSGAYEAGDDEIFGGVATICDEQSND